MVLWHLLRLPWGHHHQAANRESEQMLAAQCIDSEAVAAVLSHWLPR